MNRKGKNRMERSAGAVFHLFNHYQDFLGGGFKYVLFSALFEEDSHFD